MSRFLKLAGAAVLVQLGIALAAPPTTFPYPRPLPEPSAAKLPRWRGFNLLYLFNAGSAHTPAAVIEEDFRLIASLGFNFVRIPMDYRIWIAGTDWEKIDPTKLADVDRVVAMGEKYGIHVALNFHRAPGYTVAKPAEARSLWTDAGAQQVCADHWALFARRYRGVPSTRLSFNLFNEPSGVSEAGYFAVVKRMVEAIRAEDPSRLVLCDGLDYGNVPPKSLQPLGVALCTRGYRPMNISHFRASWMSGSDRWPTPDWPAPQVSAFLYGTSKSEFQSPLILTGPLGGKTLRLHVNTVSDRAKLRATDGQGTVIWEHAFVPGPGQGEWKKAVLRAEWKSYANVYDRDYTFTIPSGTNHVEIRNVDGDWVTVDSLAIDANGRSWTLNLVETWGLKQAAEVRFDPSGETVAFRAASNLDRAWLRDACYGPWREAQAAGLGVMIGEMGAFHFTPHAVVLRWMDDVLATAQDAGWGWALWEFRGGFGVLDSKRSDVAYESWEGHQLDRAMLDLLQKR